MAKVKPKNMLSRRKEISQRVPMSTCNHCMILSNVAL